jgi:hypothetical protein
MSQNELAQVKPWDTVELTDCRYCWLSSELRTQRSGVSSDKMDLTPLRCVRGSDSDKSGEKDRSRR